MPDEDKMVITLTVAELRQLLREAATSVVGAARQIAAEAVKAMPHQVETPRPEPKGDAPASADRLIRVKEVAQLLGTNERSVWRMATTGVIPPAIKLGIKSCRWRFKDIESIVASKAAKAEAERQRLAKLWRDGR